MAATPVYLWTMPMFHCNRAWGVAAQGGTNVCLRKVTGVAIFPSLGMVVNTTEEERRGAMLNGRGGGRGGDGAEATTTADDVIEFCRARLPRYTAPRAVVFLPELPKTATGKVHKFALRDDKAKALKGSISSDSKRSKL
ncbi:hypothetical protein PR202_ga06661 [Eleusine coracana subsp. coracana]|uniref:AMP-binding enzyme C-terminal domain-containing protein n=1 Tax=Eleusine coracana subsp. coracana TaxID=191504 RepID=A0AAV5BXA2_ELECO|nr:hypothetical protein PR202_ga06661 [Eleusine coracana subsp. coracana]